MIRMWMGNDPIIHMVIMFLYNCANKVSHSWYTAVNDGKGVCCFNCPKTKLGCGGAVIAILGDKRFSGSKAFLNTVLFLCTLLIKQDTQYYTGDKNDGCAAIQFLMTCI